MKICHISSYSGQWDFDAVVVGSGPSGSVVANTLASKGKNVLVLEYGPLVSPGTLHSEHQKKFPKAFSHLNENNCDPWTACCVGGGMEFYDAITFRYRESDLKPSKYISSDMDMDWPISLTQLNPHYDWIEKKLNVSGTGSNPEFYKSSRAYLISEAMKNCDLRAKQMPLAIKSGQDGCNYCSACDERSCPTGAKASVISRSILNDKGLSGSITVLYGIFAENIEENIEGLIDSVNCIIPFSGRKISITTQKIILCCNAIQSAALLLRSKSSFSPDGIGNKNDLVGRGLMFKISGYSVGYFEKNVILDTPYFGPHATIFNDDFYVNSSIPSGLGGLIYEANFSTAADNIGKIRLHYIAGEESWSKNRIMLDSKFDGFGIPYIKFLYENSKMDMKRIEFLADISEKILLKAGAVRIEREPFTHAKGSSHLHGTLRAGVDPKKSVVDSGGKVHGYKNLYVMDGGVMNFSGNSNPTHTIMANARRMAFDLVDKEVSI